MTFTPPEYPASLTHKYWNKKKGLIARMKNDVETGIGEAADDLEKLYAKIDWSTFDYARIRTRETFTNAGDVDKKREQMDQYYKSSVEPTRKAAQTLSKKANLATTELKKAKYNDAAKSAETIMMDADDFVVTLSEKSHFFSETEKSMEEHEQYLTQKEGLKQNTLKDGKILLSTLLKGLKTVAEITLPALPETDEEWRQRWNKAWAENVKNNGRNIGNMFKLTKDPKIAKHSNTWATKFMGFSAENMQQFRDYDKVAPADIIVRTKQVLQEVAIEAKNLLPDLN